MRRPRPRHIADRTTSLVDRLDLESVGVRPDGILASTVPLLHGQPMQGPPDRQQEDRSALNLLEVGGHLDTIDLDPLRTDVDGHRRSVHIHDVLQASSRLNSQTTSTCAVCGNMS